MSRVDSLDNHVINTEAVEARRILSAIPMYQVRGGSNEISRQIVCI